MRELQGLLQNLKGPVLKDKKEFKASRTGVRETHEVVWTDSTPLIYKISDITVPERVTPLKISNYQSNTLVTLIIKIVKSDILLLFVPDEEQHRTGQNKEL